MTSYWSVINIEGYCGLDWTEGGSGDKPEYCSNNSPDYLCLANDCPHFFFCRYETGSEFIYKDRLIGFLEDEMNFHHDDADGEYAYQKWLIGNYLMFIIEYIRSGRFDA